MAKMDFGGIVLLVIAVFLFGVFYSSQDHYAEAACSMFPMIESHVIPVGTDVKFSLRGWVNDAFDDQTYWDFYTSYDGGDWEKKWSKVSLYGTSWTTSDLRYTFTFGNPGMHTMQFYCAGTNGDKIYSDKFNFMVGTGGGNNFDYIPTLIATGSIIVAVGAIAGAAVKIVKSAKSKKSSKNQTKEKVPYDSSKDVMPKNHGTSPELLRPVEKKPKTLWVEPPSPKVDGIPYDDADEIPTPTSALEFTEYLSKHWDRLQNANWAKYFEDVSNCIIASGGALNTTKAWVKKVKEIQHGKALDLVEYEGISAGDLLDYSENNIVQTKDVKGYARVISLAMAEELFDKSVKVTKVNIMPPSVGEMIKDMTPTPFKVLQFLVDYFGENIMDSYSCLWASFKKLPVNSRPDNSVNIPDQPDTSTGWKGV